MLLLLMPCFGNMTWAQTNPIEVPIDLRESYFYGFEDGGNNNLWTIQKAPSSATGVINEVKYEGAYSLQFSCAKPD